MAENNILNVGLDIGANAIKAVSLGVTKTGFELLNIKVNKLTTLATENGAIIDYGELVHGVKDIMEQGGFTSAGVSTALKGPSTVVRRLYVPCEKPAELDETFRWMVDQYVAIDPEEMSVDFELIPGSSRLGYADILVTAAKKDTLTDFVSVLESSKVIPRVIEPESLSLTRIFRAAEKGKTDFTMLIHVGSVGSLILFLKDGQFDFSREIGRGGKYCTELIRSDLGVDAQEAELIKINPEAHSDPAAVRQILDRIFSLEFIQEVDYCIKMYELRGGASPIKIKLSGGGCETFGLKESLVKKYAVPVEFLDPWRIITTNDEQRKIINSSGKYNFNVALGLAMHGKVY